METLGGDLVGFERLGGGFQGFDQLMWWVGCFCGFLVVLYAVLLWFLWIEFWVVGGDWVLVRSLGQGPGGPTSCGFGGWLDFGMKLRHWLRLWIWWLTGGNGDEFWWFRGSACVFDGLWVWLGMVLVECVCVRARVLLWVICVVDATSVFWFLIWLVVSLSLVVVDDVSVVFWLISFSLFVF